MAAKAKRRLFIFSIAHIVLLFMQTLFVINLNADVIVRRDVTQLSSAEKDNILQALYLMKETPSKYNSSYSAYDYYATAHRAAFLYTEEGYHGHNKWSFFPWHRGFNYLFELEMQEIMNNASFRLPYWDLRSNESTYQTLFDESFLGGNGDPNSTPLPFMLRNTSQLSCNDWIIDQRLTRNLSIQSYECLSRRIGNIPGFELPPNNEWERIIDAQYDYDIYPYNDFEINNTQLMFYSFRARIEGLFGLICNGTTYEQPFFNESVCPFMHNGIHAYIGGHITSAPSTVDPIFFLLHNWIDAMWALYQDKYGLDYTFPKDKLNEPFFDGYFNNSQMTAADVLDVRNTLNYVYQIQLDDELSTGPFPFYEELWFHLLIVGMVFFVVVGAIVCCNKRYQQTTEEKYQSLKY